MMKESIQHETLIQACQEDLKELFSKKSQPFHFVDDDSIFSQFYSYCLDETKISYQKWTPANFVQSLNFNEKIEATLLLPGFHFRIFNLNFDKIQKVELGKPYWVHISSNEGEALKDKLSSTYAKVVLNPLKELRRLFTSYLQHEDLQQWLLAESCSEYHNDRVERYLLVEELRKQGLSVYDLYKKCPELADASLEVYLFNQLKLSKEPLYKHIPVHRLYQRILKKDLSINLFEREIYGDVH